MKLRRAPTRYMPRARIAAGGMAEVWRADAVFEDGTVWPVAIKRMLPKVASDPTMRSMFEDEARLGMLLRHPNIVRVYDARDVAGTFIMVMELMDGAALKQLLDGAHARGACMPLAPALHIVREVARGLAYAHTAVGEDQQHLGIVHRDVSPHNVLLARDGTVKLADFGLADANVHETARSQNLVGGKLGYLAPEVVMQQRGDHRVDLFGAGIILWEMLGGRRLFKGRDDVDTVRKVGMCKVPPLRELNDRVPIEVDEMVARMLARNPDERVLSAHGLVDDLNALIEQIDPRVSDNDVALMVGLRLAKEHAKPTAAAPADLAEMLGRELDEFAEAARGSEYDIGAMPLDPSDFGSGRRL